MIAYFDASYNHPQGKTANDPKIHTIAVYMASRDNWRKLRKEWKRVLDSYNVPFFHVKDFEYARNVAIYGRGKISSKSPYIDWTPEKFNTFEQKLHKTINRKGADGIPYITARTSNILVKDYEETLPSDLKDHPGCRSYFILNVINLINAISQWADLENYREYIEYVFSEGDDDIGDISKWFHWCSQHELTIRHYRLSLRIKSKPYDIQSMKTEPALQMVDCPAYELNRAIVEWAKKDFQPTPMSELRKSLSSLCKIDHFGATLRRPELLQVYDDVRKNDQILAALLHEWIG
ncbi:MAG: hypothetical protein SF339_25065 [Blastocatellia bacterium]|nr:hypothetical protein [Blastocatellia bacterium]